MALKSDRHKEINQNVAQKWHVTYEKIKQNKTKKHVKKNGGQSGNVSNWSSRKKKGTEREQR